MNVADNFAVYAAACLAVGRGGIAVDRIRELASREDGLSLSALDADAAALGAVAAEAEEALSAERRAAGVLAAAWRGRSGSAATDLVEGQCATAASVLAALREAAEVLERLRGRLARQLEAREEAGVRIADRRAGEHPRWLAWSRAVLDGTADEATAAAVAAQVGPYVETDIAGDWVSAMTAITESVAAAYREALRVLGERPAARFAIPSAPRRTGVPGAGAAAPPGVVPPGAAPQPGAGTQVPIPAPALASPGPVAFTAGPPALPDLPAFEPPAGVVTTHGAKPDGDPEPPDPDDEEPFRAKHRADALPEPDLVPEPDPVPDPESDLEPDPVPAPESGPAPVAAAPAPVAAPAVEPVAPPGGPLPAEAGFTPPTPCELAAEALPQIGE